MWIDVTLINFDHIAHIHRETRRKRHGEFIGTVQCLGEYMLNSEVVWIDGKRCSQATALRSCFR
jgi:hypothetical protein